MLFFREKTMFEQSETKTPTKCSCGWSGSLNLGAVTQHLKGKFHRKFLELAEKKKHVVGGTSSLSEDPIEKLSKKDDIDFVEPISVDPSDPGEDF